MTVLEQLVEELDQAAHGWTALADPRLHQLTHALFETEIRELAPAVVEALVQDDEAAADTVADLMGVLGDRPPEWYGQTPLGRVVARSHLPAAVSYSMAAAMLGVTKGTISQLVSRGKLDRHPEGGVSVASIIARAAERADLSQ